VAGPASPSEGRSTSLALPQQHRLKGHRIFDRLYRHGRSLHAPDLVLRLLEVDPSLLPACQQQQASSPWRCAVVVSNKVSKRAVQRNRLRRLIHAHLLAQPLGPRQPLWMLISLKPGSLAIDSGRLLEECSGLLRKAGLTHAG